MNPFQTFSIDIFNHKITVSPLNDERTKCGAEEPGLLLHNITLMILYYFDSFTQTAYLMFSFVVLHVQCKLCLRDKYSRLLKRLTG